jgi:asparagine synthase (glutamine-hydrolysing)
VELASRIPADLKIGHGGKHVLKQAARKFLPANVIDRPKGYFPVPSLRYLKGDFLAYVTDILTSSKARTRGLFNRQFIDHMLQNPEAEMSPKGHSRLWQAALLEAWMQAHAI